jgi:WD40 repeat protein
MGRPQRPVDPDSGPVAEFASELRNLRDGAGRPSYRELARQADFSVTTLSEAAGGRVLPTLPVVRGYVRACGGDVGEWENRWRSACARQRDESARSEPPYLGLVSYGAEHSGLFFGRERMIQDLLRRLKAGRFLAVFGPSGSGKSSLLSAGLLAVVKREEPAERVPLLLTPGARPLRTLAERLAALAERSAESVLSDLIASPAGVRTVVRAALTGKPGEPELLLVVDQFEELFTMCGGQEERDRFVDLLLGAVRSEDARTRVVLGIRADFYGRCTVWPELVAALSDSQILVGPMDSNELRDAIVKPAEQTGMTVERALVTTALTETGTEPGTLAMLSHALLETWRNGPPGRLTLSAYRETGGVAHAIADTAERVYGGCGDEQRRLLRQIFLRLIDIGDDGPVTRRRVPPDELAAGDPRVAAELLERLVHARLVTTDEGAVQLAHEALIQCWPRLAEWLAEGREGLRIRRRLSGAAAEWTGYGRDPAALYRGTPLAVTREWATRDAGPDGLTARERQFLDASTTAADTERAAARRTTRRLRRLVAALVVLLAGVTAAGGIAAWQRQTALSAESGAISAQLADQSAALASANPDAAMLAALAAWHTAPLTAARSALLSTTSYSTSVQASLRGEHGEVNTVALSPGGRLLAAGGTDGKVHIWNTATGRQIGALSGPSGAITAVAFSPDGIALAASTADGAIWLWNSASHRLLWRVAGRTGPVDDLTFSPHGAMLASASADGTLGLWNLAAGREELQLPASGKPIRVIAFSPGSPLLAAAGDDGVVTLWDVAKPADPRVVRRLAGAGAAISDLAWGHGARGDMIAAESGSEVLLWNLKTGTRFRLARASYGARGLAFSRNGNLLLVAGSLYMVRLWDTTTGEQVSSIAYRFTGDVRALAYDPVSGSLALGGAAGTVQFWQQAFPPFTDSPSWITGLAVVPGTGTIVSASDDTRLRLWDRDGSLIDSVVLTAEPDAIAVSPDGKLLAVATADREVTLLSLPGFRPVLRLTTSAPATKLTFSADGDSLLAAVGDTVVVWRPGHGDRSLGLRPLDGIVTAIGTNGSVIAAGTSSGNVVTWSARTLRQVGEAGVTGEVSALAFSPDGQFLATAGSDGQITLWNPARLLQTSELAGPVNSIRALAFSPDGRVLTSGANDGTILLWNVATRTLTTTLTGQQGSLSALAFTPDGGTLLSGHTTSHLIVAWNLDPRAVARQDCRALADDPNLAQAETLVPGALYSQLC